MVIQRDVVGLSICPGSVLCGWTRLPIPLISGANVPRQRMKLWMTEKTSPSAVVMRGSLRYAYPPVGATLQAGRTA